MKNRPIITAYEVSTTIDKKFLTIVSLLFFILPVSVFLLVLILNNGEISRSGYYGIQSPLFLSLNNLLSSWPLLWQNLTEVGDALILFPLLSFVAVSRPQIWAALFAAIPFSTLLSLGGKALFAVPRPAAVLDKDLFSIVGSTLTAHNSLPSGHTITIFAGFTVFLLLYAPHPKTRFHWLFLFSGFVISIILGLSRVAVGAHWPLDVIVGASLGFFGGLSGIYLTVKYKKWWSWMKNDKYNYVFGFILLVWALSLVNKTYKSSITLIIVWLAIAISISVSYFLFKKYFSQKVTKKLSSS